MPRLFCLIIVTVSVSLTGCSCGRDQEIKPTRILQHAIMAESLPAAPPGLRIEIDSTAFRQGLNRVSWKLRNESTNAVVLGSWFRKNRPSNAVFLLTPHDANSGAVTGQDAYVEGAVYFEALRIAPNTESTFVSETILNVPPGDYRLSARLTGFSSLLCEPISCRISEGELYERPRK